MAKVEVPPPESENPNSLADTNFLTRNQVLALLARFGVERNPGPQRAVEVE